MITKNEISSLNLSPTKKDFVQIWNELMEVASKITERWDPTSTNESDPGIVLLKVLTGIADKLNYNIDKNILEAFMPTAAQMESMRKLCELVGYNIKYYQSAETKVKIKYTGNTNDEEEKLPTGPATGLPLPKFTSITNADKDITFVTTNEIPMFITNDNPGVEVSCIEGQISQCESVNENNLITLTQLDDEYRYYLPEIQIAENGIFVYNAAISSDGNYVDGTRWEQVSNLNTRSAETRVYKFGYDSFEGRPYLAFPEDVGSLIGDGLFIYFIRTSGLNGNISPRTLEALEIPAGNGWEDYSAEQFEVVNEDAAVNGTNIESISTAYSNFKKTVGTFDTLVTCRDYMNKIYSLMDASNSPYVSNILVTDIRNDINSAVTLCSCNEFGILYKETPLTKTVRVTDKTTTTNRSVDDLVEADGNVAAENTDQPVEVETDIPLIDYFDLVLYPFKTFNQVSSGTKDLVTPYNSSFEYSELMNREIEVSVEEFKTCAHNFVTPAEGNLVSINNYLRLNALIAASNKVSEIEAKSILQNVKVALVNEFNMRNLDFGEEIPFDTILSVIENADSRIKVVSLQEPSVLTTYSIKVQSNSGVTSKEYGIASAVDVETDINNKTHDKTIYNVTYKEEFEDSDGNKQVEYGKTAKEIYNKLVLRNILAGRAALLDYDETFISNNSEKPYTVTNKLDIDNITDDIEAEIDAIIKSDSAAKPEHVLLTTGPNGGVLTLKILTPESYELYETYEPSFAVPDTTPDAGSTDSSIINDITRVKAVCEIKGSEEGVFENIKLAQNEVIKFRAPNLITTKTFPAYVYYRFEKAASSSSSEGTQGTSTGSYAECLSLASFLEDVGTTVFFTKLWQTATVSELSNFNAKITVKKVAKKDENGDIITDDDGNVEYTLKQISRSDEIDQSKQVPGMFNAAFACGLIEEDPNATGGIKQVTKIFTNEAAINKYLDDFLDGQFNSLPPDEETELEVNFKYYPLFVGTLPIWSECVRSCYTSNNPSAAALPDEVLWKLSSTSNYPMGKLVLNSGRRLFAPDGDFFMNCNIGSEVYICTYQGSDPEYYTLSENSDIELQKGDKLYIHYTPSSTNEDGETVNAEPVSVIYTNSETDPIILKPSGFTLAPTEDIVRNQGISYKKYVTFPGETQEKGLLALAPNEQIELRSISKVVLDTPARFYKNFDDAGLEQGDINKPYHYELKDGEYIFYTDKNNQDAAYYGSGSVITLAPGAYIPKASEQIEVSQILEQGLHIVPWSNFVLLDKNKTITITEYQYVTLVEGDTLNILAVNTKDADNLEIWGNPGNYTLGSNAKWIKCDQTDQSGRPITYTPAGAESATTLPKIQLGQGSNIGWEVCSLLELSTSPGYAQQLRATDTITNRIEVYTKSGTSEKLAYKIEPQTSDVIGGEYEKVSVKLNTIAQSASGSIEDTSTEDKIVNIQMKVFKEEEPSKVELMETDDIITPISTNPSTSAASSSDNINNYLTKVEVEGLWRTVTEVTTELDASGNSIIENGEEVKISVQRSRPNALKLNFMIPKDADVFGIFSIYLEVPIDKLDSKSKQNMLKGPEGDTPGSRVFIDIPPEFGSSYEEVISIYNNNDSWWSEGVETEKNRLYLRAGLNCIKVKKSCSLFIKAEENAVGSILYDNMRLVKGKDTNGINLKLLNPNTTFNSLSATMEESLAKDDLSEDVKTSLKTGFEKVKVEYANEVLNKISQLDKNHDFYYNVPVENSLAIEFDNNISSFSNPYTLYDINNINNNFVVSKLDIEYLTRESEPGIRIAKSSRY